MHQDDKEKAKENLFDLMNRTGAGKGMPTLHIMTPII